VCILDHIFNCSTAYKRFVGSFESQIKYGRTAVEMPSHPIVPMDRFVVGCSTGPFGGLCQLDPEIDHPNIETGRELGWVCWGCFRVKPLEKERQRSCY